MGGQPGKEPEQWKAVAGKGAKVKIQQEKRQILLYKDPVPADLKQYR